MSGENITRLIVGIAIIIMFFFYPRTVTYEEFKRIKAGMSYTDVVEIVGKRGKLDVSAGSMDTYGWSNDFFGRSFMTCTFINDRLHTKIQHGLD